MMKNEEEKEEEEDTNNKDPKEIMEKAREEVVQTEKEIQSIKTTLRSIAAKAASEEGSHNTLRIVAVKVSGLPTESKPKFKLQLSSPVEELELTNLHDPLNEAKEGSHVTFADVEVDVATLVVTATDANVVDLGTSAPYDIKELCVFDAKVTPPPLLRTNVDVDLFPNDDPSSSSSVPKEPKDSSTADSKPTHTGTKTEDNKTDEEKISTNTITTTETSTETTTTSSSSETPPKVSVASDEESGVEIEAAPTKTTTTTTPENDPAAETDTTSSNDPATPNDSAKPSATSTAKTQDDSTTTEPAKTTTTTSTPAPTTATPDNTNAPNITTTELTASTTPSSTPLCTVTLRIEFQPSAKDQRDGLYELLNKASKQKADAIDKLRRSAAAVTRSKTGGASSTTSAVQSGFLNKNNQSSSSSKPEEGTKNMFLAFYDRTFGPNSLLRKIVPVVQNYVLFFGVVALMHYKGQELALPPPV